MFNLIPSPATSTTPAPDDPDKHKYGFFMPLEFQLLEYWEDGIKGQQMVF
eukprot:gene20646-15173_t